LRFCVRFVLRIAQEFGFGLYDGITGIVTDPYKGAKKEGGIGFVKGVGRGIMSVPFRVMGGAWSVPGYAMKGLYQEMVKSKGKSVQNYIIAARIAQGYDEASSVTQEERDEIIKKWGHMKWGIKKKRNVGAEQMDSLHSLVQQKKDKKNERSARLTSQGGDAEAQPSAQASSILQGSIAGQYPDPPRRRGVEPEIRSTVPSWRQQEAERTRALRRQDTTSSGSPSIAPSIAPSQQSQAELEAQLRAEEEEDQRELERAIAASVAESSRGDPEEDRLIASAIRASIAELERAPAGSNLSQQDEEEALRRAMAASMEEAGKTNVTEEEQKALEETLRKSLLETSKRTQHDSDHEWDSDADTEDDEDYKRIIAESKHLAMIHANHPDEYANSPQGAQQESGVMDAMSQAIGAVDADADEESRGRDREVLTLVHGDAHDKDDDNNDKYDEDAELKKVLEESEKAEKERMQKLEKQKTEEDIVMEYVRKQSLLEEEHRQRVRSGGDANGEASGPGTGAGK
jgi:hypothetical protein